MESFVVMPNIKPVICSCFIITSIESVSCLILLIDSGFCEKEKVTKEAKTKHKIILTVNELKFCVEFCIEGRYERMMHNTSPVAGVRR